MHSEENKRIARRTFDEAFNKGDLSVIDETVGIGLDHQHPDEPSFPQHLKDVVTAMRTAFPDLRFDINQMVAEGDWVACHSFMTGTHHGDLGAPLLPRGRPPVAPTGRKIKVAHTHLMRFENGKSVELWHVMDTMALLGQLGVLPNSPGAARTAGARVPA